MAAKKTVPAGQDIDTLEEQLALLKRQIRGLRAKIKRAPASIERSAAQSEIDSMEAKIDSNEAELVSIATEQANADCEHYEALYDRWRNVQGDFPLQDLKSMMVLLKCFPASVAGLTRYPKWRENRAIGLALDALHSAHEYACCILGRRASQLGLNGGTVEIDGEHCRRILRDDPAFWLTDLKDGTWPNCIWDKRKSLPVEVRRTIEKAQTVLTQLGHKLNIAPKYGDETPPVEDQIDENLEIPDPDDTLVRKLRGFQRPILVYLWKRGNVTRDQLRKAVWKKQISDKGIGKAVERLNTRLYELNHSLTKVESNGGMYYLKHPQK